MATHVFDEQDPIIKAKPGQVVKVRAPDGGTVTRGGTSSYGWVKGSGKWDPIIIPSPMTKQFPGTGAGTWQAFLAMTRDFDVPAIDIREDVYERWALIDQFGGIPRPIAKPLDVHIMGDVAFDGTGLPDGTPPFRLGWVAGEKIANVRIDPGATGTLTAQNYRLGKIGLVSTRWYENFSFHGLQYKNVAGGYGDGIPGAEQHTHLLYIDNRGNRSQNGAFHGWGGVGPANLMLNGLHIYSGLAGSPGVDVLRAYGWKVSNLNRALFLWSQSTGVDIADWVMVDVAVTVDNSNGDKVQGIIRNCRSLTTGTIKHPDSGTTLRLAPIAPGQGMWKGVVNLRDGGGNIAA